MTFHWHVAFPEVFHAASDEGNVEPAGWSGGFDVVLGNPPWEHTELKETEFFARDAPEIAYAANKKVFHNDLRRRQQRIEHASTSSAVWISGRRS